MRVREPREPETPEQRAGRALRIAYSRVLPEIARRPDWRPCLDFTRPAMSRLCERSTEFFQEIAIELGDWWRNLARDSAAGNASAGDLLARQMRDEAATALADVVRALPVPVRTVVQRRAAGQSWRRISSDLPGRAYFSLTDDWHKTCVLIASRNSDLVERLL